YRLALQRDESHSEEAVASSRALTRALVREIAESSQEAGARFLLLVLPDLQTGPELWEDLPGEKLDLEPVFARFHAAYPDSEVAFRYDSHWRPLGHRLVADTLAARIAPWIAARSDSTAPETPRP